MGLMFEHCSSLTSLDLSSFNTAKVRQMNSMFQDCSKLTTIFVSDLWSTASLTSDSFMFKDCPLLTGGEGTSYDASMIGAAYAHVDGGKSNPGYLTGKTSNITPVQTETTVKTENLADKNLSNNVVDDVYYNVGEGGYDPSDQSIVISQTTNMENLSNKEPGSNDVKNNFNGIIMQVSAGNGTIVVNVKTNGNAKLAVQVGDNEPTLATKTEKSDVAINYEVEKDSYIYIYAIISGNNARSFHRAASENAVKIYSIQVTSTPTSIDTPRSSIMKSNSYFTLGGNKLTSKPTAKGIYILGGKKVVVK
jgi:surface protein